jgi:O-antigen/teichoic acid export membrane protein
VNTSTAPVAPLLNTTGHQDSVAWIFGGSAVMNIVLNAILIPRFGIVGAASATAISTAVYNVWFFVLARRRLKINCFLLGTPSEIANAR